MIIKKTSLSFHTEGSIHSLDSKKERAVAIDSLNLLQLVSNYHYSTMRLV